jgi:hypothetical protein
MEKNTPIKKPRERLVVEIDPDLVRRLKTERIETRRPVNHIVEEVLARHYDAEAPVVTG